MSPSKTRRPLVIAGTRIRRGESTTVHLPLGESYQGDPITVPVHVIAAKKPGPTVLISGCIHGDELNGLGVIRELLFGTPPNLHAGTLICMPVVNVFGLEHHSRYMPDRRDLNRAFPGSPSGNMTSRLAYALFSQVVKKSDYLVDFHSAAQYRTNYPNVRADFRDEGCRMLAKAFGCELTVDGRGPEGSLRRAATSAGIPCIILEAGEVWKIEPTVVEVGVRGAMNVLKELGMVQGELEAPRYQTRIRKTTWVRAENGGTLSFAVRAGQLVKKDQLLATNFSMLGAERSVITSPIDGIVLGMTTIPVVKPGDPAFHIAALAKSTHRRIQKQVEASDADTLYQRTYDDLATNVHTVE